MFGTAEKVSCGSGMFRAIIILAFVKNKIRMGSSKRERVGQDVSAGHPWVRRTGERPSYILRVGGRNLG